MISQVRSRGGGCRRKNPERKKGSGGQEVPYGGEGLQWSRLSCNQPTEPKIYARGTTQNTKLTEKKGAEKSASFL